MRSRVVRVASLFDGRTGQPLPIPVIAATAGAALSADGNVVVACTYPPAARLGGRADLNATKLTAYALTATAAVPIAWDPLAGRAGRPTVSRFAFGPTGASLACTTDGAGPTVTIWDLSARPPTSRAVRARTRIASALVWSPDGRTLAIGSPLRPADLIDVATGTSLYAPPVQAGLNLAMAAAPDGRSLVAADANGVVARWSLVDGSVAAARDADRRQ